MAKVVDEWLPAGGVHVIAMQYKVLSQVNSKDLNPHCSSIFVSCVAS